MKIVFVDDEEVILGLLKEIFVGTYDEAEFFSNESYALEYVKKNSETIDLIICDYRMNNLNGLKFLESLRKDNIDTKFILFSAYIDNEVVEKLKSFKNVKSWDKPDVEGLEQLIKEELT